MRGLLITVLVLVAIAVGADFGARAIAENRVGAALQQSLDLPTPPSVDIRGFPFLTQAAHGRYDDVGLSAPGIRFGELRDLTLTADLHGVSLPLQNLISARVTSIPTETVTAGAEVSPVDLARVLRVSDVTVEPVTAAELARQRSAAQSDPSGASGSARSLAQVDPSSSVRLRSTTTLAGQTVRVAVIASFKLTSNRITLSARDIAVDAGDTPATKVASGALRSRLSGFSASVDPGQLPFSITATDLRAENGKLVVSGTARNVDLLARAR